MNITPLLNSLSQIPNPALTNPAVKGGALNLARLSQRLANTQAILNATSSTGTSTTGTGGTGSSGTGTIAAAGAGLANESVFLQLLVAQLKNQDPDSPADGTAFVTQLAQFTTLEQDTQSSSDLNQILALLQASNTKGGAAAPAAVPGS